MLGLANFKLFIKSQEAVIGDDIRSYATDSTYVSPFSELEPHAELAIRNLCNPDRSTLAEIQAIVEEVRSDKEKFKKFLEDGRNNLLPHAHQIGARAYKFERYWELNSGWLAESLAERAGVLEECRKRGMEGLLKVKSVRLAVGANLSLLYSHHFEGVQPKPGDSRDILHAVLASSADILVTQDGNFAKALQRIPIEGFRVLDIRSLLNVLGDP